VVFVRLLLVPLRFSYRRRRLHDPGDYWHELAQRAGPVRSEKIVAGIGSLPCVNYFERQFAPKQCRFPA